MLKDVFSIKSLLLLCAVLIFCNPCRVQGAAIDSLKQLLQSSIPDTEQVYVMIELSEEVSLGCEERLKYAQEALAIAREKEWQHGIYRSLVKTGDVYKLCLKDYNKAQQYFETYARLAAEEGDERELVSAYSELAIVANLKGAYEYEIDYYKRIISNSESGNVLMGTYANLAQAYVKTDDYNNAIIAYEQSLKILNDTIVVNKEASKQYKVMQIGLMVAVAEVYTTMKDFEKAIKNYELALEANKALDYSVLTCSAEMGLGQCYAAQGQPDKSINHYKNALEAATNSVYTEVVLNLLAEVYLDKRDLSKALAYGTESKTIATQNDNKPQLAVTNTTLGKIYAAQGQYNKAITYLDKAVKIAQDIGARGDEKNAWEALSYVYQQLGSTEKELHAYKQFIAIRDSIYNADKAKEMTQLMMQGQFDRERAADSVAQADAEKLAAAKLQRQRTLSISALGGVGLLLLLAFFIYRNYSNEKKSNVIITRANETIKEEKQVSENLLLNILPENVAEELKEKGNVAAKQFDNVTILFTDFKNFTTVSEHLTPSELVAELHECFKVFDEIMKRYGIEKIKTVGDAYLAVCGLPEPDMDHAAKVVYAALDIRDFMAERKAKLGERSFRIRLGINSGTVVAGIVGVSKFAYDIWGDAVNTAARMEQNSEPGKVNITDATYELVKDKFSFTYRGEHPAKNKGLLKMYFVERKGEG